MKYLSLSVIILFLLILNCTENTTTADLSSENDMKSFSINSHSLVGEIDDINKTVRIKITPDIDRTNLTPTIQISSGASINPPSGAA